jgi:hypothetical protein
MVRIGRKFPPPHGAGLPAPGWARLPVPDVADSVRVGRRANDACTAPLGLGDHDRVGCRALGAGLVQAPHRSCVIRAALCSISRCEI